MIFLQSFIKFDQGISKRCVGQTFDGRKKEEEEEEEEETEQTQYVSQTLFGGYKYGRHRQFLLQIGRFLKIFFSELELLCQMNRNLMGGTYGRLCIKFPQSRMKGERHRVSPLSL